MVNLLQLNHGTALRHQPRSPEASRDGLRQLAGIFHQRGPALSGKFLEDVHPDQTEHVEAPVPEGE